MIGENLAKSIKIRNLKSIESLDFEIPRPGVHLLSGTNGVGKTTLLACLRRIGNPNAFQFHFLTSYKSDRLDTFARSEVIYCLNGQSVTYAYAGERWVPRPRRSSNLLAHFGYPDVFYIGATASRLTARPEDFAVHKVKPALPELRDAANAIFSTDKFGQLKTINLKQGNKNQAFVIEVQRDGQRRPSYASERNFSLGELCVLKLLRELISCKNGSLVLIDELELALHPRAQIGLLKYLEKVAADKALTVIVSTHSVTLLKCSPRERIIFLDQQDHSTIVLKGCFPAYAIGGISLSEERTPDVVVYVEDEAARCVTNSLISSCIAARYVQSPGVFPTIRVLPVGDFRNVVRFYDRNRAMLPDQTRQWILLDHDVEAESIGIMASSSNDPMREVFHKHSAAIRYLPWTPEVGLIKHLGADRAAIERKLREKYLNAFIHLAPAMVSISSQNAGPAQRGECKTILKNVIKYLRDQCTGVTEESITEFLYALFSESFFTKNRNDAMQLFGPLIG
jgi:predicted ATPase